MMYHTIRTSPFKILDPPMFDFFPMYSFSSHWPGYCSFCIKFRWLPPPYHLSATRVSLTAKQSSDKDISFVVLYLLFYCDKKPGDTHLGFLCVKQWLIWPQNHRSMTKTTACLSWGGFPGTNVTYAQVFLSTTIQGERREEQRLAP